MNDTIKATAVTDTAVEAIEQDVVPAKYNNRIRITFTGTVNYIIYTVVLAIMICTALYFGTIATANQEPDMVYLVTVHGPSMLPTLEEGGVYVVSPDTNDLEIERGQIVVFETAVLGDAAPTSSDVESLFIKRVIGVPGDVIIYDEKTHTLNINGKTYNEPYLMSQEYNWDIGAVVVPDGCVFVMGDNRIESYDSRHFGCLPIDEIFGIADLTLNPAKYTISNS